jgi:hypothetical protein
MKIDKEISILIDTLKSFFNSENELEENIFDGINWQKMEKVLRYHSIRPILLEQIKKQKIDIPKDFLNRLVKYARYQAVAHLSNELELKEIQKEFALQKITLAPFKRITYQNQLYVDGLREAGDIDLLINRIDLPKAFELFLNRGYIFTNQLHCLNIKQLALDLINAKGNYEIPLNKGLHHIDLHWDISYGFLPYNFPENFILSLENEKDRIFWTMLNHHGAKEFWLKLKHLVNLGLFTRKYEEDMDCSTILKNCQSFGTKTILLHGFYLLKQLFDFKLPPVIENALANHIYFGLKATIVYWNKAEYWEKPIPRILYEKILLKSQDEGFNKLEYFRKFYNSYAVPNHIEPKRFINFPRSFKFLNFVSKVIS